MSRTASFCPLQPPTKSIKQPEVLLAASFSLSELCQAAKPACLLQPILAYNMLRSTGRQQSSLLWIKVSLQILTQWQRACLWHCIQTDSGQLSLPSKTAPVSHSSRYNGQRMKPTREEGRRYKSPGPEPDYVAYASAFLGSRYHY